MSSEPIDPDRAEALTRRPEWDVLAAISVGGVLGAEARYGLAVLLPHRAGTWPWATLSVNVVGSLLIGALMTLLLAATQPHRLVRPFLGVGVLGGFTTFSTFAVDVTALVRDGRAAIAGLYVAASLTACLGGVAAGAVAVRTLRPST